MIRESKKMNKTEMERELLLGDSIVAFTGAVFWAISGRPLFGAESLSQVNTAVTGFLAYFYVAIGAAPMILALLLALGSMVPFLRSGSSSLAMRFSPILKMITLLGLVLSWNSVANELPQDQWWYDYLFYIGLLIVLLFVVNASRSIVSGLWRRFLRPLRR